MAKAKQNEVAYQQDETQSEAATAVVESKKGGQGAAVVLPNGIRRIDFIRDNYYESDPPYAHNKETCKSRSDIKNEINEMYKNAGQEDKQIAYQIVFASTKEDNDPRKAVKEITPAAASSATTEATASA